tara:strand:+ start:1034 stop:3835 length:2802 start_codon:yes stop_codon:yes gene_type:complete
MHATCIQAKKWAIEARDIMQERMELQSIFEQNKLDLTEFDAYEFHTHKKSKLTDDERGFYERVTRVLDESHPVQEPMTKQDMKKLLAAIQNDSEALEDVDILDPSAECGENDKVVTTRLATFDEDDDDKESVNGIEDEEDEPQSVIEAQKWMGFRIPADMFAQLQEHQRDGLWLMCERAANDCGTLLAHAPGLGKTLTTLCFLSCLKFKCKTARSIVVCDKSLLLQWEAQVSKFNSFLHLRTFTVDDSSKLVFLHSQWKRTHGGVLIMNTELFRAQLVDDKEKQDQAVSKRARGKARVAQPKCKLDITADTTVVVDEAHKFLQTGHSEFYSVVSNLPTNLLILLTGTPMQHSLCKYYNMVKLIAPDLLPDTNLEFRDKYSNKIMTGAEAEAEDDLDAQHDANLTMHILVKDLEKAVAYKMADAVLKKALPPKIEFIITHPLDDDVDPYADWSGTGMDKREKVHAHSRDTKTKIFLCLMSKFDPTERCLVFSSRLDTLKHMKEQYESDECHCGLLTGEVTNIYDRNAIIDEFRETSGSVLFLSTELGACGLDLSVATRVIILDVSWNPLVEEQAVARAYRLGQEGNVYVYRLVAMNTVEERAYILGLKKRRLASTIDGDSNVACAYKDVDLIVGDQKLALERHSANLVALTGHDHEKQRMEDLLSTLVVEHGMDDGALIWSVHDINATVKDQHDHVSWIHNQYDNELNRRISVGEAPRLLLDDDDNEIKLSIDTVYDDDGNLQPPTSIACLSTEFFTKNPCINFYYPSGDYVVEDEEDEEEIEDYRNIPRRKLTYNIFDGNSEIFGIFAPTPAACIENGVTIELYRLELTPPESMDPDEYDDDAWMNPDEYDDDKWDKMNVDIGVLKRAARTNRAINMFDLMNDGGLYLFADGLWVYKIRLVNESGKMSCFSPPSAIVKIEARDYEKKGESTDE